MSIGHRALENPSAECPRTFIPGDGCPGTLISAGHPSLLHLHYSSSQTRTNQMGNTACLSVNCLLRGRYTWPSLANTDRQVHISPWNSRHCSSQYILLQWKSAQAQCVHVQLHQKLRSLSPKVRLRDGRGCQGTILYVIKDIRTSPINNLVMNWIRCCKHSLCTIMDLCYS